MHDHDRFPAPPIEVATWPHDGLLHAWWVRPGRLLAGEYPGHPDSVRARQRVDLLVDAGVRTFVDLTTPADRLVPYRPLLAEIAATRRLDLRHKPFPVPDLGVVEDHRYDNVVSIITNGLTGGAVYVHCWGGFGRTGTVVGCVLADEGLAYDDIVTRIVALRAGTRKTSRRVPEMPEQHAVIRRRASRRL